MTITINGEERKVDNAITVRALIEMLDLGKAACAAEVNKTLVPRREHDSRRLNEGDVIELVSLVGGG